MHEQTDGSHSQSNNVDDLTKQIQDDAQSMAEDVRALVDESAHFVREQMESRPYATLGVAFGLGYVLGGGVPTWAGRFAMSVALRAAVAAVIGRATNELAED